MKQKTSGMLAFVGILAVAGCYSYTGEAINNANYNTLQATPQFAVVRVADSDQMIVRLVNDANNGAVTSYTLGSIGAGIQVHYQVGYRPVYDSKLDTLVNTGDKNAQQYYIVGVTPGKWSFTLTPTSVNTGITTTVNVVVTPRDLGAALSKISGAAGDTIIITAPTGTVFSQTSAVTFTTGTVAIVARSADSTTITMVASGGVTGPATVTKVGVIASPTVAPVTLVSSTSLTTTAVNLPVLSATSAAAGATVTLTAGANTVFSQTSVITFATGSISVTSRSADSTSISFLVGPGITGPATVTKVGLISAPTLAVTSQTSSNSLTTTALTVAPTTVGSTTPALGTSTTVALSGGLRFTSTSHIFIGGVEAGIVSTTADSSTATIVPMATSTGLVTYTNIVLSFLNTVTIAVPGDKSITVGTVYAGPTDAGAGAVATASTIVLTGQRSTLISDGGGAMVAGIGGCTGAGFTGCRVYKITNTANSMHGELRWNPAQSLDLGIYMLNAAGTSCTNIIADNAGAQSGGPEISVSTINCGSLTAGNLTAGAAVVAIGKFGGADPTWYQFRLSQP